MKRSINKIILLFIVSILLTINSVARPAYPAEAFAFTVKTDNNGSSSDLQFDIPTHPTYSSDYNYNVDCEGDGTYEHTGITGDFTCNYTNKGTYTIAIGGIFPAIYFHNEGDKEKITSVSQWGTQEWKTMGSAFSGASNLVVHAYDNPDLSNVNNMNSMFYNATALTFTFSIDDWDVSFVEDMSMMFTGATVFNNNISSWDVSSVTTMNGMFYDATAFNQDIENWDTSKVLYLSSMFLRAENFNQDIGDWDVSSVMQMTNMFWGTTAFNQDIGDWDVSKVTHMSNMFKDVSLSLSNYDNLLLSWSKLNVQNGVSFSAANSNYILQGDVKDILVNNFNWTIIDADIDINNNLYITSSNTISVKDGEQAVGIVASSYGIEDTWYQIS